MVVKTSALDCRSGSTIRKFVSIEIDAVGTCPLCHTAFNGYVLSAALVPLSGTHQAYVAHYCSACDRSFFSSYISTLDGLYRHIHSYPFLPQSHSHDLSVKELSPSFVRIYDEASFAEQNNLHEICGLGYRKSLEFLVKDFAVHSHPDEQAHISAMPLSQCIREYIPNEQIRVLAARSAWLGNDEAHYLRKHEDRSVSDLKKFIHAIETLISAELAVEDALTIVPS